MTTIKKEPGMEKTTEEIVLAHHGYKRVVFEMRKNNEKFYMNWTMKLNADPRKVGHQLAKDLEYGYNKERIMFGLKGKIICQFIAVIRS